MSLMQALMQRLLPLFGGLFASQVETGIVLEQAEQLNAIEEKARQYEREGKDELAEVLRYQSARIQSDDPGRTGVRILANLEVGTDSRPPTPLLTAGTSERDPARHSSKSKGTRRTTRRSLRQARSPSEQATEPSTDEENRCKDE